MSKTSKTQRTETADVPGIGEVTYVIVDHYVNGRFLRDHVELMYGPDDEELNREQRAIALEYRASQR